ncbi:MAG TPA: hypothetical protein VEY07_09130 [Thermoplasmata archaeon]|nr:hypothetical protein [Thermoplasmata archaeon]
MNAARLAVGTLGILGILVVGGLFAGGAAAMSVTPATTAGPTAPVSCLSGATLVISPGVVARGAPVHVMTIVPGLAQSPCAGSAHFVYSGLPAGCAPIPLAQFTCVASVPGSYSVFVAVHSAGSVAFSHANLMVL